MGKHRNTSKSGGGTKRHFPYPISSRQAMWCRPGSDRGDSINGGSITTDGHICKNALQIHMIKHIALHTLPISQVSAGSLSYPDDWTCYYIHIRVTLREGRGDQPPPSHALNGLLIADILQESLSQDPCAVFCWFESVIPSRDWNRQTRTGSFAITETDLWFIPSSGLCELVLSCSLM